MATRPVKRLVKAKPTLEGAGVHLHRAFGFGATSDYDPFLLLDDFRNERPGGLPGRLPVASAPRHRDDHVRPRGHGGARRQHGEQGQHRRRRHPVDDRRPRDHPPGDAEGGRRRAHARLPALGEPAVVAQDDGAALPGRQGRRTCRVVVDDDGTEVRVVCGSYHGTRGPVDDVAAKPVYLDVSIPAGKRKMLPVETTSHAFAYVFAGAGKFCNASQPLAVPTEPAGWADAEAAVARGQPLARSLRPGRRGGGPGRRRRHAVPADLRAAARRAGGLVRPHRHEHAGGAPARVRAAQRRDVPEARRAPLAGRLTTVGRRHIVQS